MKEERKVIEPNAIVAFYGDVKAAKLNELFKDFQGDISIFGSTLQDGESLSIKCNNLYIMGRLGGSDITVDGNLYIEGDIDCCDINVNGCLTCKGAIDAFNINVSENLYAKFSIFTNGYDINVGGDLICDDEVEAAEIVVLHKLQVRNSIQADSISDG